MYTGVCPSPKIYEHCSHASGSMAVRTCEALHKPKSDNCQVGCRCPDGRYEDNHGACVTQEKCTCTFGEQTYNPGDNLELKCHSWWSYSKGVFQMGGTCTCCQEKSSEMRQVQLTCRGNKMQTYTYKHITACECSVCKGEQ